VESYSSLNLRKLLFQPGAFVFAETSPNVAAVEASYRKGLETEKHRLAQWAKKIISCVRDIRRYWSAEHHPRPPAAQAEQLCGNVHGQSLTFSGFGGNKQFHGGFELGNLRLPVTCLQLFKQGQLFRVQ